MLQLHLGVRPPNPQVVCKGKDRELMEMKRRPGALVVEVGVGTEDGQAMEEVGGTGEGGQDRGLSRCHLLLSYDMMISNFRNFVILY